MINVYNIDRAICYKHIATSNKTSISYQSKIDEAHAADAQCRKKEHNVRSSVSDPEAMWGLPDRKSNFNGGGIKSDRKVEQLKRNHSHESNVETPPSKRKCKGLVGKQIETEFSNDDGNTTWWPGTVMKHNSTTDTYEAYFSDDCTTIDHLMKTIE